MALWPFGASLAQEARLSPLWKTDSILPVPESVLLDKKNNLIYVSLIGTGDHSTADGNGTIGKLTLKGEPVDLNWVGELHSPKGISSFEEKLYVADLKQLVIIDIKKGKIIDRMDVPTAGMLNDVAAAPDGSVYVSDSKGGNIYVFRGNSYTKLIGDLNNPNGILIVRDKLYFVDSGELFVGHLDGTGIKRIAGGMAKGTDGLQMTAGGDFLISCWQGLIYFVEKSGKTTLLLDAQAEKKNTADIAYDAEKSILYVPTFFKKSIEAYQFVQ